MPIQPAAEIARRTPDEQPQALPAPRGDGPKRSSTPLAGSRDRVQQRTICPLLKPSPANRPFRAGASRLNTNERSLSGFVR